jgi:Flp pilus assembly protein TadG
VEGSERGDATVEAVLVTPVLLVLILVVFQFVLWYHAEHVAHAAAEEGARAARGDGATAAAGQFKALDMVHQLGPKILITPQVTATRDRGTARVEVHATAIAVIPGLHFPVDAVVQSPTEEFRAP